MSFQLLLLLVQKRTIVPPPLDISSGWSRATVNTSLGDAPISGTQRSWVLSLPQYSAGKHNTPDSYTYTVNISYRIGPSPGPPPLGTLYTQTLTFAMNLNNLTITDTTSPQYVIAWDPATMTNVPLSCTTDHEQTGNGCYLTYNVYSTQNNTTPVATYSTPINTPENANGSHSWTWVPTSNDNRGTYTYKISATIGPGPPEQVSDSIRSSYLTISNITLAGQPVDGQEYAKIRVNYSLTEPNVTNATSCKVQCWGYIRNNPSSTPYWDMLGEENASTAIGSNYIDLTITRSAIANVEGSLEFVVIAEDNHANSYKNHSTKFALPTGKGIYSKILDVPYHWQETNYWCGQACTQMWLDYVGVANLPSQTDITQLIVNYYGSGGVPLVQRTTANYELAYAMNQYTNSQKYNEYWNQSADTIINREAAYIADSNFNQPCIVLSAWNSQNPTTGHARLTVGCTSNINPSNGGSTIYGLWLQDPWVWSSGQPFYAHPAYISIDVWKSSYLLNWNGYYWHTEDPIEGYDKINNITPAECNPPTKPFGKVNDIEVIKQIATDGIALHMLNVNSPLAKSLIGALAGEPIFVKSLEEKFEDYYMVPFLNGKVLCAYVVVNAESGLFHGACAVNNKNDNLPITKAAAETIGATKLNRVPSNINLVWKETPESGLPFLPIWQIVLENGEKKYITQTGHFVDNLDDIKY